MKRTAWWGALLLLMAGCVRPDRAVVADVDPASWCERIELRYTNPDTITMRTLRLFLRHDQRFEEDTLTVQITTLSPDSLRVSEYHRLTFHYEQSPAPLKRVVEVPYRRGVRLTRRGDYRFLITPTRTVRGAEAVGLMIDNE